MGTPLTLLLIVAVWRFAEDERDLAAGLALSALLYKPQFGLPLLALVVFARRWRIVRWWAFGAAGLYLAGAAMLGLGWVQRWLEQVAPFNEINLVVNGDLMVSAAGWWQNLLGPPEALVLAGLSIVGAAAVAAVVWWRRGLTTVLVAFGAAVEGKTATGWYALGTFVVLSYTQLAAATLGWSPLFPLLAATLVWAVGTYSTSSAPPRATHV